MDSKRCDYIDIAKGIGMLCVIWGHILIDGWSYIFVYSFHMPLFFFISGMLYKNEKYDSLGKLLKSRLYTLLIPYAIFSVLTWGIWAAGFRFFNAQIDYFAPLLQTVLAQGSNGYMVHNVALWFPVALFVVEVMYYFISKLNRWLNLSVCVCCAVIGHFMLHNALPFDLTKLPWNIEAAMSAILFYSAGNLLVKERGIDFLPRMVREHRALSVVAWAALSAVTYFVGMSNGHVSIGSNDLGRSTPLYYLAGFCGTAAVLILSALAESMIPQALRKLGCVRKIGRDSFYYMALHIPVKSVMCYVVVFAANMPLSLVRKSVPHSLAAFALTLLFTTILVLIAKGIRKGITSKRKKA